jgi:hypothetical protein
MSETNDKTAKRPKVRRVFGRVKFTVKQSGVEQPYVATMDQSGVTLRRKHGRRGQLLTFPALLDALAHQYMFKL